MTLGKKTYYDCNELENKKQGHSVFDKNMQIITKIGKKEIKNDNQQKNIKVNWRF